MPLVTSGVEYGHLRQLAMQRVKDLGQQLAHGHLPHRLLTIAQVSAAVTCERAKLASSMCITKSIRTKWSSFEETTSLTAAGKRFCRKNTLVACNDIFSECLCRYEDPKQDILIGLLRSVFISSFTSVCVPWHGVCFVTYSSLAAGFASAPHLRPSAPNSQYAPSPEPKTYRSVFFPVSLSFFTCRVTLLLQVRSRQSFFRAEQSVNNSTGSRRLLYC